MILELVRTVLQLKETHLRQVGGCRFLAIAASGMTGIMARLGHDPSVPT